MFFLETPCNFSYVTLARIKVDAIIEDVSGDLTLTQALAKHCASASGFYKALESDPEAQSNYQRARQMKADRLASEIIPIADDRARDPNQARNAIEARKWLASKYFPRVYADRLDVNVTERVDLRSVLARAEARVVPLRDLPSLTPNEVVETNAISPTEASGSKPDDLTKDALLDPLSMLE